LPLLRRPAIVALYPVSQTARPAATRPTPAPRPASQGARSALSSFTWLALATTAATYALIIVGGVVRTTGSGDACPDWPRCHGELLPPLEWHVLIEFSHRLVASVVGLLVVATAVSAWRSQRRPATVVWGSTAAVGLVIGQIILGGATVLSELSPGLVVAHLAMATALLLTLLFVAIESARSQLTTRTFVVGAGDARFGRLAAVGAVATFGLVMTGAYVSGSNAGLAITDWPLFNGRLLPDGGRLVMIHATHRLAVVAVGLLVAYLAIVAWRSHRGYRAAVVSATLAVSLYGAQVLVGAANVWTKLSAVANAAHLALAVAILATLASVAMLSLRSTQATQERRAPAVDRERQDVRPAVESLPVGRPG